MKGFIMSTEIERKFIPNLYDEDLQCQLRAFTSKRTIIQAYFTQADDMNDIRVRIIENAGSFDRAFLTFKNRGHLVRKEFEFQIDQHKADELFKLCVGTRIVKTATWFVFDDMKWRLDTFHNENAGLDLLELEFPDADIAEDYEPPDWAVVEVTQCQKFYNGYLANKPFTMWTKSTRKKVKKILKGITIAGKF